MEWISPKLMSKFLYGPRKCLIFFCELENFLIHCGFIDGMSLKISLDYFSHDLMRPERFYEPCQFNKNVISDINEECYQNVFRPLCNDIENCYEGFLRLIQGNGCHD